MQHSDSLLELRKGDWKNITMQNGTKEVNKYRNSCMRGNAVNYVERDGVRKSTDNSQND